MLDFLSKVRNTFGFGCTVVRADRAKKNYLCASTDFGEWKGEKKESKKECIQISLRHLSSLFVAEQAAIHENANRARVSGQEK